MNFLPELQMTGHVLGKRGTNGCDRYEHPPPCFSVTRCPDHILSRSDVRGAGKARREQFVEISSRFQSIILHPTLRRLLPLGTFTLLW